MSRKVIVRKVFFAIAFSLAFSSTVCSIPCFSLDEEKLERINELSNIALSKENDLEIKYTRYRSIATKEPKFSRTRYFLLQQSASAFLLSSSIVNLYETGKHLKNPDNISLAVLRRAAKLGILSSVFEGGSSAIELIANGIVCVRNMANKLDPGSARREFVENLKQLDEILRVRKQLVKDCSDSKLKPLLDAETNALKSFRDLRVFEFADLYADVRSNQTASNVYYVLDIVASSLYFASYILSIKSLNNPVHEGPASVSGLVGSAFGISSAPLSALSYHLFYNFWFLRFSKHIKENCDDAQKSAISALQNLRATSQKSELSPNLLMSLENRLETYKFCSNRYDQLLSESQKKSLRYRDLAQQGILSGPAFGAAYMTDDILNAVGAYRYPGTRSAPLINSVSAVSQNSSVALNTVQSSQDALNNTDLTGDPGQVSGDSNINDPTLNSSQSNSTQTNSTESSSNKNSNAKKSNKLAFAGSIVVTTSSAVTLGMSTWSFLRAIKAERDLSKQGALPSQLMESRLKKLEQMNKILSQN